MSNITVCTIIKQINKEYMQCELALSISKPKLCILIEVMTGFP